MEHLSVFPALQLPRSNQIGKSVLAFLLSIVSVISMKSQESRSKFSLSANFGVNGSFFVKSYRPEDGPPAAFRFYEKNFIGITGGIEGKYVLSNKGALIAGYTRSVNSREGSFTGTMNGVTVWIWDFTLQHRENYFYAGYERQLLKNRKGLRWQFAVFYERPQQQEIEIMDNNVNIWERSFNNAKLNEIGAFVGLHQSWRLDPHFTIGIQARFFYILTALYASEITLTPTITYNFDRRKGKR
jgi:hypothetical protein